jgi:hypothetical protein
MNKTSKEIPKKVIKYIYIYIHTYIIAPGMSYNKVIV